MQLKKRFSISHDKQVLLLLLVAALVAYGAFTAVKSFLVKSLEIDEFAMQRQSQLLMEARLEAGIA